MQKAILLKFAIVFYNIDSSQSTPENNRVPPCLINQLCNTTIFDMLIENNTILPIF